MKVDIQYNSNGSVVHVPSGKVYGIKDQFKGSPDSIVIGDLLKILDNALSRIRALEKAREVRQGSKESP
jgi:hypothetical protein